MRRHGTKRCAGLLLGIALLALGARADAVGFGATTIDVTSIDAIEGLLAEVVAPARIDVLFEGQPFERTFLELPIAAFDLDAGVIDHAGALRLVGNGSELLLGNLRIDFPALRVFAQVNHAGPVDFPLFALEDCGFEFGLCQTSDGGVYLDGFGLFFAPEITDALAELGVDFGVELTTPQFGVANVIVAVPEPAAAPLLGAGLAVFCAWRRR